LLNGEHYTTDSKYWIFYGWAFVEGVHHYLYKLSFGKKDTLKYVVESRNLIHINRPLGGAIGIQLKKLRARYDPEKEYLKGA